tara:strand:- start:53 stop:262 length:210 start_codon:yes stop_codon:yes gene_type:complete
VVETLSWVKIWGSGADHLLDGSLGVSAGIGDTDGHLAVSVERVEAWEGLGGTNEHSDGSEFHFFNFSLY